MRKLLVALFAAALVVAFVAPSFAAVSDNFSLSGRIRIYTIYNSLSKELAGLADDKSDADFSIYEGTHRIVFKYKSDDFEATYDMRSNDTDDEIWGRWQWGPGSFTLGRQYTLTFVPFADRGWGSDGWKPGFSYFGSLLQPGMSYRLPMGKVTLSFGAYNNPGTPVSGAPSDMDITLPMLEAKVDFVAGPTANNIFAGYRTSTYQDHSGAASDIDVDSMVIGGFGTAGFGAFGVSYTVWYDMNLYNTVPFFSYPTPIPPPFVGLDINAAGNDILDASALGWEVSGGFKINQMLTLNAGIGNVMMEMDCDTGGQDKMAPFLYTANLSIAMTKYFTLMPYFWVLDYGKIKYADGSPDEKVGSQTQFGAYWQLLF